jgi:hypothetical protein
MKPQRVGLSVVCITIGFIGGYLARGRVEREPEPAEIPRPPSPRAAKPERSQSEPGWRTVSPSVPPEHRDFAPPMAAEAAPSLPIARLPFPDGGPSPSTFEERLRSALGACRPSDGPPASLATLDCTEYPCIAYLSLSSGASLRAFADCPALTRLGALGVEGMGTIDDAGTTLAAIWVRPDGELGPEARLRIGERACGLGESYGASCDACTKCLLGCLQ